MVLEVYVTPAVTSCESTASQKVLDKVLFESVLAGHDFYLLFLALLGIFSGEMCSHQGTQNTWQTLCAAVLKASRQQDPLGTLNVFVLH